MKKKKKTVITVKAEASEDRTSRILELEDINMTQEEWDNASDDEKHTAIQDALDSSGDQPYWALDSWKERD